MDNEMLQFWTMMGGFIYPAYATCKASVSQLTLYKWQRYWIVNAIFHAAILYVTDPYIYWLPLYGELKLIITLWLLPTGGNGSDYIFERYIVPFMVAYQKCIDEAMAIFTTYIVIVLYAIYKFVMFATIIYRTPIDIGNALEVTLKEKAQQDVQEDLYGWGDHFDLEHPVNQENEADQEELGNQGEQSDHQGEQEANGIQVALDEVLKNNFLNLLVELLHESDA